MASRPPAWTTTLARAATPISATSGPPNTCPIRASVPIVKPPFYGVAIYPSDIGTSCGLATNEFGQLLREDGSPIRGLYACGNDMASIMAGVYPGSGITIGPGMTFGFIVGRHAAADLGPSV
jgi:succinate dehydrogenase/fumarate reductase flavoprotein subunit